MNGIKNVIAKRRSIRKYKDKKVPDNLLREIFDAARLAPSGCNAQPARLKDEDTKKKLKSNKVFEQNFIYTAPIIIICCGDPSAYPREDSTEYGESYAMRANRDISIAAQNLVLRATELGIGTCYIGWMHRVKAKKVLNIDRNYVISFAITLGYSDEKPKARPRKKLKEILLSDL